MADNEPIEVNPTIELEDQVDMGSTASEYNAEAWAVGQRGGVDVDENDQTYHNNSKYYAGRCQHAETAAAQAEAAAAAAVIAQGKAEAAQDAVEADRIRAEAAADEATAAVEDFSSGLTFKGSVEYVGSQPGSGNTLGDEYLVLYSGSSGTNYIGQKYAWDGTAWKAVGVNLGLYRDADGDLCEEN